MQSDEKKTGEMKPVERLKTTMSTMASHMQERASNAQEQAGRDLKTDRAQVDRVLAEWPQPPRGIADKTIEKYGLPNEAMPTRLVWYNNGPWKRTEVQRDEIAHAFPAPHTDYITNYINYGVSLESLPALAEFDGSVLIDRTRGEAGARCDMEAANILSLNLMHEIVKGQRDVKGARDKFAEQMAAYMMSRPAPYAESLLFDPPSRDTGYIDESVIGPEMIAQMGEKMKDLLGGGDKRQ